MGRKLPFFPTCGGPSKTLSFRASTATTAAITGEFDDMFATGDIEETSVESVIQGLSTERFFFNMGKTSSILEDAKISKKEKEKEKEKESGLLLKESVMMEMQSTDPFADFKKSMQEMVDADQGLKKWENLQELLSLYLAVNDKINHGYIIGAFVDLLLLNLCTSLSSSSSSSTSSCSTASSSSIVGQEKSLLMESGSKSFSNNKNKMICSELTESALSFTSSSGSSSATCSSTCSHCLSPCSLEDDEEDHHSPQKSSVSDNDSSSKV